VRPPLPPPTRPEILAARRTILAAVDALTDAELMALAKRVRTAQAAALTGGDRAEVCGPSEPLTFAPWTFDTTWQRAPYPAGCACLTCRNKMM